MSQDFQNVNTNVTVNNQCIDNTGDQTEEKAV